MIFKTHLLDFQDMIFDKGDLTSLIFTIFILSHFKAARESLWFLLAIAYTDQFKTQAGRYSFPAHMIIDKPDRYVIFGGHMNVGENKKSKLYNEVVSTYWMERIKQNNDYRNFNKFKSII